MRTDLRLLREAIDKYHADTRQLPGSLAQLAEARYLRAVPVDPVTESDTTWVAVPHPDGKTPGLYDVRSGSDKTSRDGSAYGSW